MILTKKSELDHYASGSEVTAHVLFYSMISRIRPCAEWVWLHYISVCVQRVCVDWVMTLGTSGVMCFGWQISTRAETNKRTAAKIGFIFFRACFVPICKECVHICSHASEIMKNAAVPPCNIPVPTSFLSHFSVISFLHPSTLCPPPPLSFSLLIFPACFFICRL